MDPFAVDEGFVAGLRAGLCCLSTFLTVLVFKKKRNFSQETFFDHEVWFTAIYYILLQGVVNSCRQISWETWKSPTFGRRHGLNQVFKDTVRTTTHIK